MRAGVRHPAYDYADEIRAFWDTVRDSLIELHGLSSADAARRVLGLRQRLNDRPTDNTLDIIYHAEPFDVACNLAEHEIRWEDHQAAYRAISDRHQATVRVRRPISSQSPYLS